MSRSRRLASMGLLAIAVSGPARAGPADASSVFLAGRGEAGSPELSVLAADELSPAAFDGFGSSACCVSEMASDPDADGGAFEVPQVFAGVVETNPVVVTVDLDSADASHRSPALGARAAAAEPVDEVDGMKAGASSRPQAMTAMAISAGLCGLGWMRYRLYAQRRRWRRAAAKRRARRR